jgi:hypothetical protein
MANHNPPIIDKALESAPNQPKRAYQAPVLHFLFSDLGTQSKPFHAPNGGEWRYTSCQVRSLLNGNVACNAGTHIYDVGVAS